jgi:nicotinamide/nicotinate riboside kinase
VPIHPVHNVQDWDAAAGAISWDRLVEFLRHVKETGAIPPDHRSHDHLNEQKEVKVEEKVLEKWIKEFETIKQDRKDNEKIIWGLVDGFLLYWNKVSGSWFFSTGSNIFLNRHLVVQDVFDQLDVRIMLRVPHDVLKKRRNERHGYHTAGKSFLSCHFFAYLHYATLTNYLPLPSL